MGMDINALGTLQSLHGHTMDHWIVMEILHQLFHLHNLKICSLLLHPWSYGLGQQYSSQGRCSAWGNLSQPIRALNWILNHQHVITNACINLNSQQ
jgi:hypothetical protein